MPIETPSNPRKRGAPTASGSTPRSSTGHERKRAKLQDARTIAVQSSDPALKSGSLGIEAFVKAREFEIKALETGMKNSKRANNKRAFQIVPRELRRRTASHNVKRIPKRLRGQAAREIIENNTPTHTARRRKPTNHMRLRMETAKKLKTMAKKKDLTATLLAKIPLMRTTENTLRKQLRAHSRFRKRQRDKTWLPTHVWHAKRAKMVTQWRYAIAQTPTEKCYRQTHRASSFMGAIAWDETYFSTILVKGDEEGVKKVLRAVCGRNGWDSEDVVQGKRATDAWVYKVGEYPTRPIGPVKMVWCVSEGGSENVVRKVMIRVHPSAFLELWKELLKVSKLQKTVTIEDLRFEIGSIEVAGPLATDSLLEVLRPSSNSMENAESAAIWNSLKSLTNPATLPPGAILGFDVSDPRLCFPPRMEADKQTPKEIHERLFEICSTWPLDKTLSASSIFDRKARTRSVKLQSSQKKIDGRKADTVPGEYPSPLPTDPKIPILLLASRRSTNPQKKGVSGAIGSWTVLMPWKWVLPVWYALMHSSDNIRFGGLDELRQVAFENAVGYFPDDFPGTRAGIDEEMKKGVSRKEWWEKRPKGKRIEMDRVPLGDGRRGEVGDGFICDWGLFEGDKRKKKDTEGEKGKESATQPSGVMDVDAHLPTSNTLNPILATNTNEPDSSTDIPSNPTVLQCWTVPSYTIQRLLAAPHLPLPASLASLSSEILSKGTFTVSLALLGRGCPTSRARIYRLPSTNPKLKEKWKSLIPSHSHKKAQSRKEKHRSHYCSTAKQKLVAGNEEYPECPGEEDLVGFITTGNFNLKEGKSVCIGALGIVGIFGEYGGKGRKGGAVSRVVIVRDVGRSLGRLARWDPV